MAGEIRREYPEEPDGERKPSDFSAYPEAVNEEVSAASGSEMREVPQATDKRSEETLPVHERVETPYQPEDDVMWPVTYGDPLPETRDQEVEHVPDSDEFILYDEGSEEAAESLVAEGELNAPGMIPMEGEPEAVELREPPSFVGWLRNVVLGTPPDEQEARLRRLNHAISQYPDSPANYVLRGELYLKMREYAQAAADFRMALSLAEGQYAARDWGIVAQAMRDRARVGLEKAQRHGS